MDSFFLSAQRQNYLPVEFRSVSDALLPSTDVFGLPHFDIVHEHGYFDDISEQLWSEIWASMNGVDQEAWRALVFKTDGSM